MKFLRPAAALTGAAAIWLLLSGCVSSGAPIEPSGVQSNQIPPSAESSAVGAPATGTAEHNVDDLVGGQADACDVLDRDEVATVVTGEFDAQPFGGTYACIWTDQDRSLVLGFSRTLMDPTLMASTYQYPVGLSAPCPDPEKSLFASNGGGTVIWCERDKVTYLLELKTDTGNPGLTQEEQAALAPLMETVLGRVA